MSHRNNGKSLGRRGFLKAAAASVAGAASATMLPGTARAASRGEELATLHNLAECIGCGACVDACREENSFKFPEPEKPFPTMYPSRVPVADWSTEEGRAVDDRLTPYNWLYIQTAEVEYEGETYEINIPRRCMHCQNPPCADLCPWGAAGREANGIVRINEKVCLGGSKCKSVCPWKIPERQTGVGLYLDLLPSLAGNGVMYKCDRCHHRIAEGEVPACVDGCPFEVQTIGPREEIVAMAHELAESMNGFIYGETENGGTNTLYVSPVPFELLNEAVETGPGKPHLAQVKDMMGQDENLGYAAMLAPVAGIAGAALTLAGKARKTARKAGDGEEEA
ncbi:MAG: 4Fe-4S dicluster domain-containing protein [Desulfovibrio sp.]|nr:MAG: 4Fe-4S dicluster domain-containing protein [Desulfovibrio sp.]